MLIHHGFRISEVAKMSKSELRDQLIQVATSEQSFPIQIQALSATMLSLDEHAFNKILSTNIIQIGLEQTMLQIVFPFLREVGVLWMTGSIHTAHEHFITNLVKQKLYVAIDGQSNRYNEHSRRFLLYLPEAETHELGLLFANYLLRARGHEVIYLGQNTPETDIKEVFEFYHPDCVMTSITSSISIENLDEYTLKLKTIWGNTPIWVTGGIISQAQQITAPEGIQMIRDLQGLLEQISSLDTSVYRAGRQTVESSGN